MTGEKSGAPRIEDLVASVADDLAQHRPIALGFECPLFVPAPEDSQKLGRARPGEGDRPWSAQAGATSMVAGTVQTLWVLRALRPAASNTPAFLDWEAFRRESSGLFLWEAFVSAAAKGVTHEDDAAIGARAFRDALPNPFIHNALPATGDVLSLIGAALLRSGWSVDPQVLSTPCVVIKAVPAIEPGTIQAEP